MNRPERRTRRPALVAAVLASAVALGACRGENLFSLTATGGSTAPTVNITAPTAGYSTAVGDSVLILAEVTAVEGLITLIYSGEYADSIGGLAYITETASGNGATFLSVTNYLTPIVGQVAGEVYVALEVTDQAGATAKDSVKVTIF